MKFRFQINGSVDLQDESIAIKDVYSYITKVLEGGAVKVTGIHVFEMREKKDKGSRKRGT
jgi:hypothetical protein